MSNTIEVTRKLLKPIPDDAPDVHARRLRQTADVIEAFPEHYDQGQWGFDWDEPDPLRCGSSRCVAGWAAWLNPRKPESDMDIAVFGAEHYGLSHHAGNTLFAGSRRSSTMPQLLRRLADIHPENVTSWTILDIENDLVVDVRNRASGSCHAV